MRRTLRSALLATLAAAIALPALAGPRDAPARQRVAKAPEAAEALQPVAERRAPPPFQARLPNGLVTYTPIVSFAAQRFDRVVRQNYDLSCGAAAMSTLLTHYYGRDDAGEKSIIEAVINAAPEADKDKIARFGFSMLELKRHAERIGMVAGGYKLKDPAQLSALRAPAITLINSRGYSHFVVIKGVKDGRVFIADPAFGNRVQTLEDFAQGWNPVILIMVDPNRQGDASFMADPTRKTRTQDLQFALEPVLGTQNDLVRAFGEY
jgi:uncharacterized protein